LRTCGYFALALQAQGAQPESGTGGIDFVQLLAHANWLTKSILLILLLIILLFFGGGGWYYTSTPGYAGPAIGNLLGVLVLIIVIVLVVHLVGVL